MARSSEEIAFSREVGRICEEKVAPLLLAQLCDLGSKPINLNEVIRPNHKWADWAIYRNHVLHIVAVRGRIRWEKPQRAHFRKHGFEPRPNGGFNGQGERLRQQAVESVREKLKLSVNAPIESMWLSVPVDIDGTYDAYWGPATEMREITRSDNQREPGLAVPMSPADVDRYTRDNRKLADRQPHEIPWQMGGHWACKAREHWLQLNDISNRDERILCAIRAAANQLLNVSVATATSDDAKARGTFPERGRVSEFGQRQPTAGDTKTVRMAHRIRQGDLPRECLCLLRVLASNPPKMWSMPEIAEGMRAQVAEDGRSYRNDRYNEAAAALDIAGLVRSSPVQGGRGLLRQIKELGLVTLKSR